MYRKYGIPTWPKSIPQISIRVTIRFRLQLNPTSSNYEAFVRMSISSDNILSKVSLPTNRRRRESSSGNFFRMYSLRNLSLPFFVFLFIFTLSTISITCYNHPLFPTQIDRLDWAAAWLKATVADYYGSSLCFSGIVLSSEPSWTVGCIWVAAFCLAGSPACCLWVILRLLRRGSLKLEEGSRNSDIIGTESERLS